MSPPKRLPKRGQPQRNKRTKTGKLKGKILSNSQRDPRTPRKTKDSKTCTEGICKHRCNNRHTRDQVIYSEHQRDSPPPSLKKRVRRRDATNGILFPNTHPTTSNTEWRHTATVYNPKHEKLNPGYINDREPFKCKFLDVLRISGLEIDHLESEHLCVREDFPCARGSLITNGIYAECTRHWSKVSPSFCKHLEVFFQS